MLMSRQFSLLLLFLLSVALVGCSETTSEEHFLAARQLLEERERKEAVIELKTALSKDAQNGKARALLGRIYFQTGDFIGAEKELTHALESGDRIDRSGLVPLLAKTLLHLGEFDRVDHLPVDDLNTVSLSETLASKALSRLYQGDLVVAEEILRSAASENPVPLYTQLATVRFVMEQEHWGRAKLLLAGILDEAPDYHPAWNLLGDVHAAQRNPRHARRAYTQVLKREPRAFDARLNRAMMQIYLRDYKNAREDLRTVQRMHPAAAAKHPGVSFANGILLLEAGRFQQARKAFEKTADFSYAYPLAYYYMAVIDLQEGSLERALSEVYRFLALAPESVLGPKLAARLELEFGGYHAAEQLLEPIVAIYPKDVEALNLLANAKLGLEKGGEGVELLSRVVMLKPGSGPARARLGAGYFATGELDLGIEVLRRSVDDNPQFEQADILLILTFLREGEVGQAVKTAREYKNRHPGSVTSYSLLGRAYFAAGQYKDASWAYNKALEIDITDVASRHGLAEIALQRGDFKLARKLYRQVLKFNEDNLKTQLELASTYALQGNEEIMLSMLQMALDDHPESTEPLLMLIRFYVAAGRLREAEPYVLELIAIERGQPDALATIAGFQLATARYHQALITLEQLLTIQPDVAQYHFMQSRAFAGINDEQSSLAALARAAEFDPQHFYTRVALARLTYISGSKSAFRSQLAELREIAPHNIDVLRMDLLDAQDLGDTQRVARNLNRIHRQVPSTESVLALADFRFEAGDTGGAVTLLEDWIQTRDDDLVARQKLADFYTALGRRDRAIAQYRAVLAVDFDNVIALNNLAWELRSSNPVEALRHAQRARNLAPDSATVMDTLAMALLANDKAAEAERVLDRALEHDPGSPDLLYHRAQVMLARGDRESALSSLQLALADPADFAQREAAEAMLRRLM